MANLSDLAQQHAERPAPGWIVALGEQRGFVEDLFNAESHRAGATGSGHTGPADEALAEAYDRGLEAGLAAANKEAECQKSADRTLKLAFTALDSAARDSLCTELEETVLSLCEAVLAEHALDREALSRRCLEAANRFGEAAARCILHVHPEDAPALEAELRDTFQVHPDETLERGSLRLEGPDGLLSDGPAEWRRAIALALRS